VSRQLAELHQSLIERLLLALAEVEHRNALTTQLVAQRADQPWLRHLVWCRR
jgi:hypothetical protein